MCVDRCRRGRERTQNTFSPRLPSRLIVIPVAPAFKPTYANRAACSLTVLNELLLIIASPQTVVQHTAIYWQELQDVRIGGKKK